MKVAGFTSHSPPFAPPRFLRLLPWFSTAKEILKLLAQSPLASMSYKVLPMKVAGFTSHSPPFAPPRFLRLLPWFSTAKEILKLLAQSPLASMSYKVLPLWSRNNGPDTPQSSVLLLTTLVDVVRRSEEHTSELQSLRHLVCRLLLEKKEK